MPGYSSCHVFILYMTYLAHLPIWTQQKGTFLTSGDLDSGNGALLGPKEDNKGIFSLLVQSLEHSSSEVVWRFEFRKIFGVPPGPVILIEVFPKIWEQHRQCVLIGAFEFEAIQHKGPLGQMSKGVLDLWLSSQCLLTFIHLPVWSGGRFFCSFHSAWGCCFSSCGPSPLCGVSFLGWLSANSLASNWAIFS